jgi:hypothetical protein
MATHRARDDLDDFLDTIDLTCSSPEPEPAPRSTAPSSSAKQRVLSRPAPAPARVSEPFLERSSREQLDRQRQQQQRQQQQRQQQHIPRPPPATQTLPRPVHHPSARQSSSNAYHAPAPAQSRHVNPQHVARILESSDVRAIRHVLLTLCKASPALSGAVARGLAPYSVFAQAVVGSSQRAQPAQRHRGHATQAAQAAQATQRAHVKAEMYGLTPKGGSGIYVPAAHDQYRITPKQEPGSRAGPVMPPAHINSPAQRQAAGARVPGAYPSQSAYAEREGSPTDSDDSDHIVPIVGTQPQEIRTPLQSSSLRSNQPASSLSHSQAPRTPSPATQQRMAVKCSRCYKRRAEAVGPCIYHPSDELVHPAAGERTVFACCLKEAWTPGCKREEHVFSEAAGASPLEADASNPFAQASKRRKL